MVIEVLATDARIAMGVCIVPPAEDSRIGDVVRKEVSKPVDAVRGRPGLVTVSVQAMDGDNAAGDVRTGIAARENGSLDDGVDPFRHSLETLRTCVDSRICCLGRTFGLSLASASSSIHWS